MTPKKQQYAPPRLERLEITPEFVAELRLAASEPTTPENRASLLKMADSADAILRRRANQSGSRDKSQETRRVA